MDLFLSLEFQKHAFLLEKNRQIKILQIIIFFFKLIKTSLNQKTKHYILPVAFFVGRFGGLISKAVGLGIEVVEDDFAAAGDFVDVLEFFFVEIFIFTKDFRLVLLAGESTLKFAVASSSSR